jgi:hypothetical protein
MTRGYSLDLVIAMFLNSFESFEYLKRIRSQNHYSIAKLMNCVIKHTSFSLVSCCITHNYTVLLLLRFLWLTE